MSKKTKSNDLALQFDNVSKMYRLGLVGTSTLSDDLKRWWYRIRGKGDPFALVGQENKREESGGDYVWALRDISFKVKKGEVLGIIGKNGAGKSTLLKLMSQVTEPTEGAIRMKGTTASLLEVGTGMHPELTGKDNVYLNGAILGMTKEEIGRKFNDIVTFSGCAKYIDTPVKRYSSGMKVRLGFAVAVFLEADILVVDEVLAVGDAEFQQKAIRKMQEISMDSDRTVLFVSHNMNSIRRLCQRCLLLEQGRLKMDGHTDQVISEYLSLNAENLTQNLEDRTQGRMGNGDIRFSRAYFTDDKGNTVEHIFSGDPINLHIQYVAKRKVNPEEIILAVQINNVYGEMISGLRTDEMNLEMDPIEGEGEFVIRFPQVLLRGAIYNFRLRINGGGNTSQDTIMDQIDNAISLHVIPGDIWKTGKTNKPGSLAILPAEISHKNAIEDSQA